MDWETVAVVSLVSVVIYPLGVFFTAGIRLWPRWRDAGGNIRNNPLHNIEAIFWPVAWFLWAWLYYSFWLLLFFWWIARFIILFRFFSFSFRALRAVARETRSWGELIGNPPRP